MEAILVIFVCGLLAAIGFARRDRTVTGVNVSLCLTCINAIVTHGACGEELVVCNCGGIMRPMKFAVCSCTGFREKSLNCKLVTIEGFVPNQSQVYEKVAISWAGR